MKKIILILSTSLVLTACGPNEKEQLTIEQNNLKKEIQTLKSKLDNEKTKHVSKTNTLNSLKTELKQQKGTQSLSNDTYTETFKTYATQLGNAINTYKEIKNKITATKQDPDVQLKLEEISNTIHTAIKSYETPLKATHPPQTFESMHEQVDSANQDIKSAIKSIEKGYKKNDVETINEGQQKLQSAIDQFNSIQIE
ncbi:hypothetical protein [Macrococcoides caseolyticum]|uniref:hypothetical protein n=1 Tax=Macrococcoides caseolyticum TaxID=69966 RepID=UPI001F2C97EC|nr:hypothetical protein [Macrococcus caseolyticus]MCE4956095.1 hypothetical protein [Macrococcus caseolyticus]